MNRSSANGNMRQKDSLTAIEKELATLEPTNAWGLYLPLVATGVPLWQQAIETMGHLTELDPEKITAYRTVALEALPLMNNWYFEPESSKKAERDKIDAAISFIRNNALRHQVTLLPAAASARNLAGTLRVALHLAIHNYRPAQYPHLMARGLLGLAAAKSIFPIDLSDVVAAFSKQGESPAGNVNHLILTLQRCAQAYSLQTELTHLHETLEDLWQHRTVPQSWALPATAWKPGKTSLLAEVHYQSQEAFHSRRHGQPPQ